MIELDGVEYLIKTPEENTHDLLQTINNYCSEHNILNSKQELVQIAPKMSNPLYMILWGLGYLVTVIQNLIFSIGKGLNVQASSDKQLLNIADMANIKRASASLTTFSARLEKMSIGDEDYQEGTPCVITSNDVITFNGIVYAPAVHPSIELIADGDVAYVTFVAQTPGSYSIAENTIQSFDTPITNLKSIYQYTAIPGQEQESIASLRQRIQRRQKSGSSLDAAIDAIRELPGVTACSIIYNESTTNSISVGEDNIQIPPRWALVLIQGYNQNIGQTYFEHITAQTIDYNPDTGAVDDTRLNIPESRKLEIQWYTSHAMQKLPVMLTKPKFKYLYVRVYLSMAVVADIVSDIQNAVTTVALELVIGQQVTSAMILSKLESFSPYGIIGVTVSDSKTGGYSYKTPEAPDVIWGMNVANIDVVLPTR